MGLSAPKNRSKISNDPNNTTWSRNTARFGHRMLMAQGWAPGQYLGAPDAAHAAHYTAANASHIRVFLKDDNLGLGARRGGKEAAERFGLGGFEAVLGRLNGRDEGVLKEEQRVREEREMRIYESRRWGGVRFVSGGFLVGDKIERLVGGEVEKGGDRKRKRGLEREGEDGVAEAERKVRRKKGEEDLVAAAAVAGAVEAAEVVAVKSKDKKDKKRRREAAKDADDTASGSLTPSDAKAERKQRKAEKRALKEAKRNTDETPSESLTPSDAKAEKKRRKAEKRALKKAKRQKKALRKAAKSSSATTTSAPSRAQSESSSSSEEETQEVQKLVTSTSNPAFSLAGGRHAVRQRYIRQKRMASMDPRALREIFMVKSGA